MLAGNRSCQSKLNSYLGRQGPRGAGTAPLAADTHGRLPAALPAPSWVYYPNRACTPQRTEGKQTSPWPPDLHRCERGRLHLLDTRGEQVRKCGLWGGFVRVCGCRLASRVFLRLAHRPGRPRRARSSQLSQFFRPRALRPSQVPGEQDTICSAMQRGRCCPRGEETGSHYPLSGSDPRALLQMCLLCIKGRGAAAHDICSRPGFRFETHIRAGLTLPKGIWMWAECIKLIAATGGAPAGMEYLLHISPPRPPSGAGQTPPCEAGSLPRRAGQTA